jgi:hypothetical protein
VLVHLAREHPLELDVVELLPNAVEIAGDGVSDRGIALGAGKLQQLARFPQLGIELGDESDFVFQLGALAPKFLCPRGVIPDGGVFQFALDLDQAFLLGVEVKVTPEASRFFLRRRLTSAGGD